MKLYLTQLEKLINLNIIDSDVKKIAQCFLLAINDWPEELFSLDDYEHSIKKLIKKKPNEENIKIFIERADYQKNSWEAESLSQLLDVYKLYDNTTSIKEIIEDVKIKLSIKKTNWHRQ